ncbi:hypothetical protein CUU66_15925 [Peribacillus deserti]|uniref:Uncharacterized protein n=1 Tax=Peribacillus deserti TaxID=673318 RepID=A0A2N5M3S1_9BACI|nr:hypothetical protein CUU66_15925 [Peribacillus deserti]
MENSGYSLWGQRYSEEGIKKLGSKGNEAVKIDESLRKVLHSIMKTLFQLESSRKVLHSGNEDPFSA